MPASTFRATLTYRFPLRTEAITVPLPDGATHPPVRLRRPTELPDVVEVFELVDDDDWDEHQLAGYVFVGTIERARPMTTGGD